jgi:hypothetical protein
MRGDCQIAPRAAPEAPISPLAALVKQAFAILGHDNPRALLADAALHYQSTSAHMARAQGAAIEILIEELSHAEDPDTAAKAADAGESIEEYLCGTVRGHSFPEVEEHERCLCSWCGKDGDA